MEPAKIKAPCPPIALEAFRGDAHSSTSEPSWIIYKTNELGVLQLFKNKPLGIAGYYVVKKAEHTSIRIVINDPGARQIEDGLKYFGTGLKPIVFDELSPEDLSLFVLSELHSRFPPHMLLHRTQASALKAIENGAAYAIWGTKNTYKVPGQERLDQFRIQFPHYPFLQVLEKLTGIELNSKLIPHSGIVPFSKYRIDRLEERISLINSFARTTILYTFTNREAADAFLLAEDDLKKDLPVEEFMLTQRVAFYELEDQKEKLFMVYSQRDEPSNEKILPIARADLKKVLRDGKNIADDLFRLYGTAKKARKDPMDIHLFNVTADREELQIIGEHIMNRNF